MINLLKKLPRIASFEDIFIYISTLFVINFWLVTLLVTFSLFSPYPFILIFILSILFFILIFDRKHFSVDFYDLLAMIIILIFSVLTFLFFHHSLYGVRDDGVYANAGIGIVTRGTIYIKEFINFPGWVQHGNFYIPQFPFGTSSWLALNYSLFGFQGIHLFNVVPIIVGGLSFYFLIKAYMGKYAFFALLTLLTTYPIIWFSRRTISEIIFLALLWFSFYLIKRMIFSIHWTDTLLLMITCSSYLLLRGEGILYFIFTYTVFLGLCIWQKNKAYLVSFIDFIFLIPFIFFSLYVSNDYLLLLLHYGSKILSKFIPGIHFDIKTLPNGENQLLHDPNSLYYKIVPYVITVFTKYNYILFILSVVFTFIHALLHWRRSKLYILLLLIIGLNLPTFYSLFDFTIAPDQPWFLRRYVFSIIPLAYFCGMILISKFIKSAQAKSLIFYLIIGINIAISYPIMFYSDYKEVPSEMDKLSAHYSKNDIIFVDQYASGWYRLATEMYFREGLQTYYITPNYKGENLFSDFNHVLPLKNHTIFVLTGHYSEIENELKKNKQVFSYANTFPFSYTSIIPTTDLLHLENIPNFNILNFNYNYIKPQIMVPTESYTAEYDLVSYKVNSTADFLKTYKIQSL